MKIEIKNLDNKKVADVELASNVFGLPVREDILVRMVNYQRAKAQAGTHKTKGISEISGTTKKPFRQKGTGNARQGSLRSAQMRGGATIFGPQVRSHAHKLPKKVRALALKTALSEKQSSGKLLVVDSFDVKDLKTKSLKSKLESMKIDNALMIDGEVVNENFARAASNIPHIDVLPVQGINVYDILNHRALVLSKAALEKLEQRLK